jgi:hypothetical protein
MGNMKVATAVFVAAAAALLACGGSAESPAPEAAVRATAGKTAQGEASRRPRGVVEHCATRSEGNFPGAFAERDNLVVGPLVLVGATYTPRSTVREFGGDKFMALVRAGHRVTVALSRRTRRVAGLGYGPLPEGVELSHRDGHRVVTFSSCGPGERSGSTVEGQPVTFWSGFILTSSPRCVPLAVWVDDEPAPRPTTLRMGVRRCT